jgi:hypothetical protein
MPHIFKMALDNECIIYMPEHCFNSLLMHLLEIQMLDSKLTVVTIFFSKKIVILPISDALQSMFSFIMVYLLFCYI